MIKKVSLFLVCVLLLCGLALTRKGQSVNASAGPPMQDAGLVQRLTDKALQSLKDEYDVLVTGNIPAQPLIPHHDEWGHPRSSDERLADVLGRRRLALRYRRPYTSVDVDLQVHGADVSGGTVTLHATELVSLHFRVEGRPSNPALEVTKMKIEHNFLFGPPQSANAAGRKTTVVLASYRPQGTDPMIIDDEQPPADPNTDPSSPALFPEETGYVTPSQSPTTDCPSCGASPQASYYDGRTAANYAEQYAINRNLTWRQFNNDCTNFASQCLRAGGWYMTTGKIKNWNNWWYNPDPYTGQTRTWTLANAINYFITVSGRAAFVQYFSSASPGDIITADWDRNGTIDHAMVVSEVMGPEVGNILVCYHTNDTYNRSFAEIYYPGGNPPQSLFYEYHPVYNVATR